MTKIYDPNEQPPEYLDDDDDEEADQARPKKVSQAPKIKWLALKRGSDGEIASKTADQLRKRYGLDKVVFSEGEFYAFSDTEWKKLPRIYIQRKVKAWDGRFYGPEDKPSVIKLTSGRVKS